MHATQDPTAPHEPASLAQPLRDAADYLQTYGWCHHALYGTDSTTPPASLVGALAIVCYGHPNPNPYGLPNTPHADPAAFTAFITAGLILADFVGTHDAVDAHGNQLAYTIDDWNGEPYQSGGCIIATLRAAAADYDHGGAV